MQSHSLDGLSHQRRTHVVQQHYVGVVTDRFVQFVDVRDFDFNPRSASTRSFGPNKRCRHAAGQAYVIVLDENGFAKILAVISTSANADRIFFKRAKSRGRLSGIQNFRAGAIDGLHKPPGESRDSAEPLQKIQRHAFARQESARGGRYTRRNLSRRKFFAVVADDLHADYGIKKSKDFCEQVDSGQDKRGLRDHLAARALPGGDGRFSGDVPGANVFREE
jgi:hypothetical protein